METTWQKLRKLILIVVVILIILGIILAVYYFFKTKKSAIPGEEDKDFKISEYTYFSSYHDGKYYYRYSEKNKIFERINRNDNQPKGISIKLELLENVYSNNVYQGVVIKGNLNNKNQSFLLLCSFDNGNCRNTNWEPFNFALAPEDEFGLLHSFGISYSYIAKYDLKNQLVKTIKKIDSQDYNLDILDKNRAIINPSATSPSNSNLSILSLDDGSTKELIKEVYYYKLSPKNNYLIYAKWSNESEEIYLFDINKKTEKKLNISNINQVFFAPNEDKFFAAKESNNKLEIFSFNLQNLNESGEKIKEIEFLQKDTVAKIIWLKDLTFIIRTEMGLEKEISL